MSTNAALTPETASPGGRDSLPPGGTRSSGAWRSSSLAGRTSPTPGYSSTFRDSGDSSGMTPLRSHSSASSDQRQRPHHSSSSSSWQPTKRGTTSSNPERRDGPERPTFSSSSFARSSSSSSPSLGAATSPGLGAGTGTGVGQTQPLNMEDLAAKFADSKEKFATLQLPSALAPASVADKDRRTPMGSFEKPPASHFAHIKVQRTASLNQNSHSSLLSRGPMGGRLQPGGHTAQPTEMRRTASHNNAFSSGLGAPLGSSSGLSDHSSPGHTNGSSINTGSIHNSEQSTIGGGLANAQLAPFSLSQMTRSPRRSSPNPPEHRIPLSYDQGSPVQTSVPSPLTEDKHPLQHTWTLYYDITSGNNRQGTLPHNYESGLKDLGTFSTVELFARYFNWIEKPHKMEIGANYHLFKDGIKPMWEDAANANGGRWVVTLQLQYRGLDLLDRCWMELAYALVGEQLDVGDDICGAVLSRRKVDRLAVWVRDKDNVEAVNGIGKRLVKILDLAKEKITLEFMITSDTTRTSELPKRYITLETIRKELAREAQEAAPTFQSSPETDTTPNLTVDSVPATPASATAPSPGTPPSANMENDEVSATKENQDVSSASGLLISVEGKGDAF